MAALGNTFFHLPVHQHFQCVKLFLFFLQFGKKAVQFVSKLRIFCILVAIIVSRRYFYHIYKFKLFRLSCKLRSLNTKTIYNGI